MKTRTLFFIGFLLLSCSLLRSQDIAAGDNPSMEGTMTVLSSPDLYNLTVKWAQEFGRLNPKMNIAVTQVPDAGIPAAIIAGKGIGFISNSSDPAHHVGSDWNMVVGRDVIVPVMNTQNPFLAEINRKGISPSAFSSIFENTGKCTWGTLLDNGQANPVHCYMVNDPSVKSAVADFLKVNQGAVKMLTVENAASFTAAIEKDPYAIGFCRLVSILDAKNQTLAGSVRLLPIDKNGNGNIDYMEDIYANLQTFTRGVWIGKYPKALSGNIYAASAIKPTNANETAFLTWILSDGQKFLNQQGFSDLVNSERQMQLDKLNYTPAINVAGTQGGPGYLKLIMLAMLALVAIGILVSMINRTLRKKSPKASETAAEFPKAFDEASVNVPKGLYYDKTHTWAFMEKDGTVKIGIDDFLQHITGPLSGIGMKPAGVKIKKGDPLLTIIQKGKHLTIYSPVSGTIKNYNQALIANSSAINVAPYAEGWIYVIEPANWIREIQFLSMADQYKSWLKDEFSRLKEFFALALNAHAPEYAHVMMQDGGAIKDGVMAELDPKVWEDFQTKFIDTAK